MPRHPAFSEGINGFASNKHNPYKPNTVPYKEWLSGFDHAYFLNLKLNFKMKEDSDVS